MGDSCGVNEFYAETFPVARYRYSCCECDAPIHPGEKHLHARGKSDGYFWAERQHLLCRELCMLMGDAGECICFGGMKDEWREGDWWLGPNDEKRRERTLYARILKRERAERRKVQP